MRLLKYNDDGRRVSIGIAGDHQLTGAPLCTSVSITKSNRGLVKLFWYQCAEVKTQQKSIISNFQVCLYGSLVSNVHVVQGGKQMITTPSGLMIPIVYKDGLPHIEHFYPTKR